MPRAIRKKWPSFEGHFEDEKFAQKPGGQRNTGERHHGDQKTKGQKRRTFSETVEMNDVVAVGMSADDHQDQKREEGHQEVSGKIDDHGQPGIHGADRRHCDQQVTGMTDTGIGQKTLEVRLRQRREITVKRGWRRPRA